MHRLLGSGCLGEVVKILEFAVPFILWRCWVIIDDYDLGGAGSRVCAQS
jgi:hypothetical protein